MEKIKLKLLIDGKIVGWLPAKNDFIRDENDEIQYRWSELDAMIAWSHDRMVVNLMGYIL